MGTQWIKHKDGIAWEESGQLHRAGLCHGVTGRTGGVSPAPYHSLNLALHVGDSVSCVLENRRRLCAHLGCRLDVLTTPQQTHEDHVIAVGDSEIGRGAGSYHDAFPHTDALMTSRPGVLLLICIADCVPVLLHDPEAEVIAAVHCGWKSSVQDILGAAVEKMCALGANPENIHAAIGASIGKCCFETDRDVADAFFALLDPAMDERIEQRGDKFHIDLKEINRLWLLRAGIDPSRVDVHPDCTKCHPERYWSHRAMGEKRGGMAAMICLTEDML